MASSNPNKRFQKLQDLGSIEREIVPGRNLTRYLIGNFYGLNEAKNKLSMVKRRGFDRAFIAVYVENARIETIK